MASLKKRLRRQAARLPKYTINPEAFQNQNIAKAEAFGADRDIQMAQADIDAGVSSSAQEAKDITSSSSALLQALRVLRADGSAKTTILRLAYCMLNILWQIYRSSLCA